MERAAGCDARRGCATLARRCLTKDVDERPRDIGDLRRELSAIALEMSAPWQARTAGLRRFRRLGRALLRKSSLPTRRASTSAPASPRTSSPTSPRSRACASLVAQRRVALPRARPADIASVGRRCSAWARCSRAACAAPATACASRRSSSTSPTASSSGPSALRPHDERRLRGAGRDRLVHRRALRVRAHPAEAESLVKDRPRDAAAYDLYPKGREHYGRYTDASLRQALRAGSGRRPSWTRATALAWGRHGGLLRASSASGRHRRRRRSDAPGARGVAAGDRLNPAAGRPQRPRRSTFVSRAIATSAARRCCAPSRRILATSRPSSTSRSDAFYSRRRGGAERYIRRTLEIDPQGGVRDRLARPAHGFHRPGG